MYTNVAYLHDFFDEIVDDSKDLLEQVVDITDLKNFQLLPQNDQKAEKIFNYYL